MQETKQTRGMFLVRALQRILAHKEIKRSQNATVKKACAAALDEIKADLENSGDSEPHSNSMHTVIEADKYFIAFEMACQTKVPSVVSISLDCLQKMIAYGILVGNAPDSNNQGKRLIDRVVDTICSCFNGTATDENVQLQIIKALLTAVTSANCEIHEGTVLQAVRTCYNIYLASKNLVNQTTAKATLTQMLSVIFSRMENQAVIEQQRMQELQKSLENEKNRSQETLTNGALHSDDENLALQDEAPESEQHHSVAVKEEITPQDHGDEKIVTKELSESTESEVKTILDEIILKVTSNEEYSMQQSESSIEKDDVLFTADFSQMNGSSTPTSSIPSQMEELEISQSYLQILKKDAFLVFRSLCKLSMKPLSEGAPDAKSHEHRSKVLSLHLLLSIMQSSGPVFRTSEMFINAIKQYLCVSLSKNGVSTVPDVFELSLSIFLKLLENFKSHMKMQIQVFFKEIFLNILESSSSSFDHKWMVLLTLSRICDDAQSIVDIFVNYDCDINAANIYERLVGHLSKISQSHIQHDTSYTPLQEEALRKKSLECLVSILKCMVEWSKDLYVDPHSLSNLGKSNTPDGHLLPNGQLHAVGSHRSIHSDASGDAVNSDSVQTESLDSLPLYDNPETIEGMKQQKGILEHGINLFNKKPKKGIEFLQQKGMLGTSPEEVAEFLTVEERLAPAEVGDYMSENESFNKEVMYAYVDRLNFHKMDFVSAIRYFLEGFRLPGEAQKIDRLMEKFASRYIDCNPNAAIFSSADAAYVLAYSVIILTTDLHSQQVKSKISKDDYIRMNRGINDSKDLPRDYLENIYHQIETQEITLRKTKTEKVTGANKGALSALQRQQEMSHMADTAKALMEAVSHVQSSFIQTKHYDHVKPMFKLAWRSVLVAFSVCLQDSDDMEVITLCLEGMRCAIRIACIFQLKLERDTFVQALSRFSLLQANAGIQEMKTKNIDTIKTLITVAYTDGNYLQDAWLEILKCISQLELLQLIGSGVRDQTAVVMKNARSGSMADNKPILKTFGLEQKKLASIQESMGETSSQNVVVAVDRIFTGSTRLDGDAIVDFVRWLSSVSLDELHNPSQARMFSLQKIVEISYYNMGRIRIQWSRIWAILGTYFNTVGCIDDQDIAFFAVDSLRQLSMKFLEMGELPGYSFQKDFLRPFEHIMKHNVSPVIQDMAVRCIVQMVNSQVQNIKSGWKNIFAVFTLAASHPDENIVELAFQTTSNIITSLFETYFATMIPCFQDIISSLREFSCCPFPDVSMESIRLTRMCADYVAMKPKLFEVDGSTAGTSESTKDEVWVRGWFPIFFELSCVISRCKLDVRTRGLTVMFEIMKTYGGSFNPTWWDDLFQIIFRIFDQMKVPQQHIEKTDWFATTCNHALFAVCDVFTQYYTILAPTLLPSVYSQLLWCVNQDNEQLARSGVNCIENLILSNGQKYTDALWETTTKTLEQVFRNVSAKKLMTWNPQMNDTSELQKEQLNCVLTAEMIECIDRILFYPNVTRKDDEQNINLAQNPSMQLTTTPHHQHEMFDRFSHKQHLRLVNCLLEAHNFAKEFNTHNEQRTVLWKAGFKGKSKPNLIRQETTSLACAIRMLFRLQENFPEESNHILIRESTSLLAYFKSLNSESHREVWTPVLLLFFVRMLSLKDLQFKAYWKPLHSSICDLLMIDLKAEIRFMLRRYFIKQGQLMSS